MQRTVRSKPSPPSPVPNNRIQQSPGFTYTFDADGNLATRSDGTTLIHDTDNRLRQFIQGGQSVSYRHDPLGRRIAKSANSQTIWYLWDQNHLLAEYDTQGNRLQRYAYLPGESLPAQTTRGSHTYYVHGDHLQTPRLLTDDNQTIVWRARYESFGNATVEADVDGDGTPVAFNLRFPGQYYDEESGLYYNYFRDYDPGTGRYITSDPIGLTGGLNTYAYVGGNPVGFFDPFGLEIIGRVTGVAIRDIDVDYLGLEAIDPFIRDETGMVLLGYFKFNGSAIYGIRITCTETKACQPKRTWHTGVSGRIIKDNIKIPIRDSGLPFIYDLILRIEAARVSHQQFSAHVRQRLTVIARIIDSIATLICKGTANLPEL